MTGDVAEADYELEKKQLQNDFNVDDKSMLLK